MKKQILVGMTLTLISGLAIAHPSHGNIGFSDGFFHPFSGWDHLLVMLSVGMLAARSGGNARWKFPLTFLLVMTLGAAIGMSGINFSWLETAIAASVLAMGFVLCLSLQLPTKSTLVLIAVFALLHGISHGVAFQHGATPLLGMLIASGLLHGLGLLSGLMSVRAAKWVQKSLSILMLLVGGYMLI
jgi:urease accessory protein